jgi:hypothetical protein
VRKKSEPSRKFHGVLFQGIPEIARREFDQKLISSILLKDKGDPTTVAFHDPNTMQSERPTLSGGEIS